MCRLPFYGSMVSYFVFHFAFPIKTHGLVNCVRYEIYMMKCVGNSVRKITAILH